MGCFYLFFSHCIGNADLVKQELREGWERERGAARLAKVNPGCSLNPGLVLGGGMGCHPQPLPPAPPLPSEAKGLREPDLTRGHLSLPFAALPANKEGK